MVRVVRTSRAFETVPAGPRGQPRFLNAAVLLETDLTPGRLRWEVLRPIEAALGRVRGEDRFAPRPIDLDLVAFVGEDHDDTGRELPEPELATALHVLLPAAEVAPELVHPRRGRTLADLARETSPALPSGWRIRTGLAGFPDRPPGG